MADQSKLLKELDSELIQRLEVLSFEPDIYLANVVISWQSYRVYQKPGVLLKEHSQYALKKHFAGLKIKTTELVHESTYDEMIGNPAPAGDVLRVRVANPDVDG
jgi:hypothetical protein